LLVLFADFPFDKSALGKLATRYNAKNELQRHVKLGGRVLFGLMVMIWSPDVSDQFFQEPDTSNIWPASKEKK
jgi:hypothetical protein